MLRMSVLDFSGSEDRHLPLIEFAFNNSYYSSISMAPYGALYGRKCRSPFCQVEIGEKQFEGFEIIKDTYEKLALIKKRLETTFSRQKSYADPKHKNVEFQVRDFMFSRVSPMKGVMRFRNQGKLSLRYIGPFEIIERVRAVAYHLALPPDMAQIYMVFHISQL